MINDHCDHNVHNNLISVHCTVLLRRRNTSVHQNISFSLGVRFSNMLSEIVIFVILLFLFAYYSKTKKWQKFQSRGIPYATPYFPLGSIHNWKLIFSSTSNLSEQFRVRFQLKGGILFRLGSNNSNFLKPCIQCTLKCH